MKTNIGLRIYKDDGEYKDSGIVSSIEFTDKMLHAYCSQLLPGSTTVAVWNNHEITREAATDVREIVFSDYLVEVDKLERENKMLKAKIDYIDDGTV